MNILIIPGFTGYPEEKTFEELTKLFENQGHTVVKLKWPYFPEDLSKYSLTTTYNHAKEVLSKLDMHQTVLLGFSMGGILATYLAVEYKPKKLGLLVMPYQAGSEDDLQGEYKDWKEIGVSELTSSRYGKLRFPFSFIEDARKYNALEVIEKVRCPILFIVGEKDDKVPNTVTRKLYEKANERKKWIFVKGMEHKYQYQPEILPIVNKILIEFVNENGGTIAQ